MATQRCIAHTLDIMGLGNKSIMGWGDFSCSTGRKRPQRRQPATPTAGPGQPETEIRQAAGKAPKRGTHPRAPLTGGRGEYSGIHLLKCSWRLRGPERGAREVSSTRSPTPQPGEDRKRTPGRADGAGSHRNRGKEPPVEQEESGTK